jgi:hypothetical protein
MQSSLLYQKGCIAVSSNQDFPAFSCQNGRAYSYSNWHLLKTMASWQTGKASTRTTLVRIASSIPSFFNHKPWSPHERSIFGWSLIRQSNCHLGNNHYITEFAFPNLYFLRSAWRCPLLFCKCIPNTQHPYLQVCLAYYYLDNSSLTSWLLFTEPNRFKNSDLIWR